MINIHRFDVVENEYLYGPGRRLLIFTQGCSIRCNGCINQHLWEFGKGFDISVEEILYLCRDLDGVTIHGGEPLDQADSLDDIVRSLKDYNKTVVLFTGYTFCELDRLQRRIWMNSDIVISGRYDESKRNIHLQFRGSTNQKVFTHKGTYKDYSVKDGRSVAMISFDDHGDMRIYGFQDDELNQLFNELKSNHSFYDSIHDCSKVD